MKYFILEMNKMARECGLENTVFANPHGLVNNFNKSTAKDAAKLGFSLIQNEEVKSII